MIFMQNKEQVQDPIFGENSQSLTSRDFTQEKLTKNLRSRALCRSTSILDKI